MRKFALCFALVLILAVPTAAQAGDGAKLTVGEARAAVHPYIAIQVEALQAFPGLSVASARVRGRIDRIGRRRMIVTAVFTLRWEGDPGFVCLNRVYVTKQGGSIRAHPSHFDCY